MYDENAPRLVAHGYFPLPISPVDFKPAKAPVKWVPGPNRYVMFAGWNTRSSPCLTPQPGANIGVRCGNGVVAFDFDDDEAALAISEVFEPSPVNKAGQRAWTPFYRADFPVLSEDFFDGEGRKVLQVLSDGRQTVIPPSIHPDTREPYRWTNGKSLYDTPPSELPPLPADYRERIMALGYAPKREPQKPETIDPQTGEIQNGFGDSPCAELNALALKNLPGWVPDLSLRGCQRQRGRYPSYRAVATWRDSTVGKKLEERDNDLSICSSGITDFGDGNKGYSALDLVMAARSCSLTDAFEWLEQRLLEKKPDIEIDLDKIIEAQDAPPPGTNNDEACEDIYDLRPYRLKDERETKPRAWVAYKHYLLGTVSSTVAPGAVGKTSNNLVEACSMALGRDLFTGQTLKRRCRIWYHSAEEIPEEMDLRLAAIAKKYGFTREDLGDWLYVTCGFDVEIKASTKGKDARLSMPTRAKIIRTITARNINVSIFDPLAAMHSMPERDNVAMADLIYDFFGPIAYQTHSAIEIVHHTRKGPAGVEMEYTAADWRGGSASTFALRGVRVCNVMKKSEAVNFDIEEADRLSYFRITRGKNNMTRMGDVGWRQFVTVTLQNGNPESGEENEDVGVVIAWSPPTDSSLGLYSQEDKDYWRNLVAADNEYGVHPNSKQWFGCEIAKRLGLDLVGKNRKKHHDIAKAILWELIESGWFKMVLRRGEDRRDHQYLDIGDSPVDEGSA